MNSSTAALAVIGIVMTCACAGIIVMHYVSESNTEYSITYELNGGVNSSDNPSTYRSGCTVTLAEPTYYGHVFNGWYSDPEFTEKVTSITSGDATVYASWTELKVVGKVNYVLDGGTNPESNHTMRYEGVDIELVAASKEGYLFNGWCSSPEHSDIIDKIPATTVGDVTVYAWWVEIYDGKGFIMDYKSTASNGAISTGTLKVEYVYYHPEKGFFVRNTVTNAYGMSSSSTYWTSENNNSDMKWAFNGMEQLFASKIDGGKNVYCEIYEGTSESTKTVTSFFSIETVSTKTTETQYIYDGWIPIKIDYEKKETSTRGSFTYTSTTTIAYTLRELIEFEPQSMFDVDVYADVGIEVEGDGTHAAASDVTLTAKTSGTTRFAGWYDAEGNLLSTSSTYTIKALLTDTKVYAYNTNNEDFTYGYGESVQLYRKPGLTNSTWEIYNRETGAAVSYDGGNIVFSTGGYYNVFYSGDLNGVRYHGCYNIFADGDVVKSFVWYYDKNKDGDLNDSTDKFSYDLKVKYSDYRTYKEKQVSRQNGTEAQNLAYVTPNDKYIVELADYFQNTCSGWTKYETMSLVLAFTQYIEYQTDSTYMGQEEYWKFPLETLFDRGGDCEDTSILFCSIASAMHYKSAMLLFYGHMAGAIELDAASIGEYNGKGTPAAFPGDGITYYYCETTSTGFAVGQSPDDKYTYNGQYYKLQNTGKIIPVPAS